MRATSDPIGSAVGDGFRVQRLNLPDGSRTWTVLGADYLPVAPVEEFLEHEAIIPCGA